MKRKSKRPAYTDEDWGLRDLMKDVARANYNGPSEFERRLNIATPGEIAKRFVDTDDEFERSVLLELLVPNDSKRNPFRNVNETLIVNERYPRGLWGVQSPYKKNVGAVMKSFGILRTPVLHNVRKNYYTNFVVVEPMSVIGSTVRYSSKWPGAMKEAISTVQMRTERSKFVLNDSYWVGEEESSYDDDSFVKYDVWKNDYERICSFIVEGHVGTDDDRNQNCVSISLCPAALPEEYEEYDDEEDDDDDDDDTRTVIVSDEHEFFSYREEPVVGVAALPLSSFNERLIEFQKIEYEAQISRLKYRYDRKSAFEAYLLFLRRFSLKFGAENIPGIEYATFLESQDDDEARREEEDVARREADEDEEAEEEEDEEEEVVDEDEELRIFLLGLSNDDTNSRS